MKYFWKLYNKLFVIINCKLLKNHKYEWWASGCSYDTGYYCKYCNDFKDPHYLNKKHKKGVNQ